MLTEPKLQTQAVDVGGEAEHALGELDGVRHDAVFTEVVGEQRAALYRKLIDLWSSYAMYERNAGRVIPVFLVTFVTAPE